jgi:hypothetical protein
MIQVQHIECGEIAFHVDATFEEYMDTSTGGILLNSKTIIYDDGRALHDDDGTGTTGDFLRCQHCEKPVGVPYYDGEKFVATSEFWGG